MAWTNSNWITFTGQQRLTALRLYIVEIQDAITAGVSSDGTSYNPANLSIMLADLLKREHELCESVSGALFTVPTRRRYG